MMNKCPTCSENIPVEELPRHQKNHILEENGEAPLTEVSSNNGLQSFNDTDPDEESLAGSSSQNVIYLENEVILAAESINCPAEGCGKVCQIKRDYSQLLFR